MIWQDWLLLIGLLICLVVIAWAVWPARRRRDPMETALTFICEDGMVLTMCFDRRGHLVRTVHREAEAS